MVLRKHVSESATRIFNAPEGPAKVKSCFSDNGLERWIS